MYYFNFYFSASVTKSEAEQKKEEEELLSKYYTEYKEKLFPEKSKDSTSEIPRFYFKVRTLMIKL